MDSTTAKPSTLNPEFTLSARQEQLLFAALNSNKASNTESSISPSNTFSMATASLTESPLEAPGAGFDESPFIDYDYEFEADGSFDYDFANGSDGLMIGKLPGTSSDGDADTHDKRSHPDDEGEEDEEGGGKRREEGKGSKKPGRKPLTSEPTSVSILRLIDPIYSMIADTSKRSARLKTVPLNEHFGNEKRSISRTWRPKLRISRKLPSPPTMRIVFFVHK
jgi:hypothetical protein